MIALKIALALLIIMAAVLLMLLFIPFRYELKVLNRDESLYYGGKVHWLFGLIQLAYNNRHLFHVKIFGIVIRIKDENEEKEEEKLEKKKKSRRIITRDGVRYLLRCVVNIFKKYRPGKLVVKGRLGFEDPAVTGFARAIIGYFNISVDTEKLEFVYNEEVYNGTAYTFGRITAYYLVYTYLKLILYKPARQLIH